MVPPSLHPFNPKAYHALNSGLFGEVEELCDPCWTRVPLETRNPFLDRRLCRFLLRIPAIPWAMHKHLLRKSQAGILPEEILLGRKPRPSRPVGLACRFRPMGSEHIQTPSRDLDVIVQGPSS